MFIYMRDYIPMTSRLSCRLDALRAIGDHDQINWTPELKRYFDVNKEILASIVPFIVSVSVSAHALGTCLSQ